MTTKPHKSCYGEMFPSVQSLRVNEANRGKAFSVYLGKPNGMFVTERQVEVDMEQWDDCLACEEFDHCRTLAQAKLSLESAIHGFMT